ncbi:MULTISPECIES: 2-hydroxyacid dehydrogenase [Pseudoalteromonas]|uniref:2-hydroxyacid dehydrogenase n=1 Tax=Pseudoalteromonas TaxID=53246 RepID=UPI0002E77F01|nr:MULTISPECIES: glyoxylate/hydroxypyruvate reductase A [Pseudoalteromonas]MCF6143624.1 gyoxylate/hydroxypyruvate reductase A [Pseudoalteromonas mariniglutinosa NCIMB 1770]
MHVLVAITGRDCSKIIAALAARLPDITISQWPNCENLTEVEFVIAWLAPAQMWSQLPNLKVVSSFGAGVDSIDMSLIPDNVVVTRIVDENLAQDMAEYVLTHILAHKLRLKEYSIKQQNMLWQPKRAFNHRHVVILGFGELGKSCAKRLLANDFSVSAFSQSPKNFPLVNCIHHRNDLTNVLPQADYLVCLLPLTAQTKGFINRDLLAQLPPHAVLINVARGQHVVAEDLLWALDNQVIRAATLDVFEHEPLAVEHPLWSHPAITVTPHCAALSDVNSVTGQIADNVQRLQAGDKLNNKVDRTKGY